MKKTGRKKKVATIGTATLAGVLCASLLFQSILSVKASPEMMPGIETIVNSKSLKVLELVSDYSQADIGAYVSGQEPWIKLYQQKNEDGTYVKAGFTSLEDGLSRLKTKEERIAFASAKAMKEINGKEKNQFQDFHTVDILGETSSEDPLEAPLSYKEYKELYFLSDKEDVTQWKEVALAAVDGEIRTVKLKGSYEPSADGIGDYTRSELIYSPVATDDEEGKKKAEYVENIYGFTYQDSGAGKPYDIAFHPVQEVELKADIANGLEHVYDYENGKYGYYENVYIPVTDSQGAATDVFFAGDEIDGFISYMSELELDEKLRGAVGIEEVVHIKPDEKGPILVSPLTRDIMEKLATICATYIADNQEVKLDGYVLKNESGTYQHFSYAKDENGDIILNDDGTEQVITLDALYIQGKQMVSQDAVSEKAYEGYYHKVDDFTFSCTRKEIGNGEYEYTYGGNYAALYPLGGEQYKKVEMGKGNYYVSDPIYTLTPDQGTFDFVESADGKEYEVQIDHIYYQGGFTNHDWLKRFPLHLDPGDETGKIKDLESAEAIAAKEQFEGFEIAVDTMTRDDLDKAAKELWQSEHPEADESEYTGEELKYLQSVLKSYSVVYLNGAISEMQSLALFAGVSQIEYPLIVNSDAILSEDQKIIELGDTVNSVNLALWMTADEAGAVGSDLITKDNLNVSEIEYQLEESDSIRTKKVYESDRHFVKQNVYYFSGENQAGIVDSGDSVGFVNRYMNTKFSNTLLNTESFKEISDYIEEENKLRDIENASKPEEDKYPALEKTLSEARGIEYVLNYKYKRTLGMKGTIKVLDLEPAKSAGSIAEKDVLKWLGYNPDGREYLQYSIGENTSPIGMDREWYCCDGADGATYPSDTTAVIGNIRENDNTFWHTAYASGEPIHPLKDNALHFFIVKLDKLSEISGFTWKNRIDASGNPRVVEYRISVSARRDGEYEVMKQGTLPNTQAGGTSTVSFDQKYKGRYVKFEVLSSSSQKLASCTEFKLFDANAPAVEVTTMTTSEFVGKAGDLNAEYDMIFMGSDTTDDNKSMKGDQGYVFPGKVEMEGNGRIENKLYPDYTHEDYMDGLVYIHMGDGVIYNQSHTLVGLMDTDYLPIEFGDGNSTKKYLYDVKSLYGRRTDMKEGIYQLMDPITITAQWLEDDNRVIDRSKIPEDYKFQVGNLGYFRRSGNDITDLTVKKLMDFVKSGYPIITEDDLYISKGTTKSVNENVVDNSSCVYDFLDQAAGYSNVKKRNEVNVGNGELKFYLNLPKISFEFKDGEEGMPPIYDEKTNKMIDANDKTLRFTFKIKDDAIISHETETYDCKLFVDLNTDGNFAEGEQIPDIEVRDEDGNLILPEEGKYALSINQIYEVARALPDEYREVISWKIQAENNRNSYMRCSQIGVSKIQQVVSEGMSVKVLQIMPKEHVFSGPWLDLTGNPLYTGNNLNDKQRSANAAGKTFQGLLNSDLVTQSLGFSFDIESIYATKFSEDYKEKKINLDDYDMIIMGFADGSTSIEFDGAMQGVYDFIASGKSVLYAHDSASFTNYSESNTFKDKTVINEGIKAEEKNPYWDNDWGYKTNKMLRTIAGMDRYGVVSPNEAVSDVLKKNRILLSWEDKEEWRIVQDGTYDMAYVAGANKEQTCGETQGYSNSKLDINGNNVSKKIKQVNQGAITQYPYTISPEVDIGDTHGQYYQLSMEQDDNGDGESDVVVWYCLTDNGYFNNSPNDVRNNYYIYSKGNVMYTGMGHSVPTEEEMKLFVNTIVAAYHSSVSQPSVDFIERNDPNSGNQSYKYYSTNVTDNVSGNILDNQQTLYFKVNDKNLVNSDGTQRTLDLNFYKKVPVGTDGAMSWQEISGNGSGSETKEYVKLGADIIQGAPAKVSSGNVYEVTIPNLESLLKTDSGYANGQEIYVTVSGDIESYGSQVHLFADDVLTFRKQQLLNMD